VRHGVSSQGIEFYAPATGLRQGIKFGAAIDNCYYPVPKALANLIASGYPTLIFYGIMQTGQRSPSSFPPASSTKAATLNK